MDKQVQPHRQYSVFSHSFLTGKLESSNPYHVEKTQTPELELFNNQNQEKRKKKKR